MKQWICTSCEKEEIGQNTCILKCRLAPVGCPLVAQDDEPLKDDTRPRASWLPFGWKQGKKKQPAPTEEAPAPIAQMILLEFADAEPVTPMPRPVELAAACLECEAVDGCKTHDPKAGCMTVTLEKQPEPNENQKRAKVIREEVHQVREEMKRMSEGKSRSLKPRKKKEPAEEKQAATPADPHCCDTCIGGYSTPDIITMDCPDYPDVSNGTIDQEQLRATTRRLGCTFWAAPGTPPKIPNWAWCVGTRSCKSISSVDGICTKTGQKLKDMTYCPTQHLIGKPEKPKKDTPEFFEMLTRTAREKNPGWTREVWKNDPAKGEWLYDGSDTYQGAVAIKDSIEETRPEGSKIRFILRPSPEKPRDHGTGGGPQPFVQECCGTCGHHKGRKTFHESCPRLSELMFKGGIKSAKVLMDETAGNHPCLFWISKDADRFGPCPEKNSMGTCMHGAYSCPHKTEEARAAVGCTYPIQPPHYAGDSPVLKKPASKKSKKPQEETE